MLRIENVDVAIGSVSILRKVNLSVGSGQFAGLIGRNGAGKTTLMRSIIGALKIKGGTIAFGGCPLHAMAPHCRAGLGIGYMPEDRRLVPELTVEENMRLPGWAARVQDGDARLERVYAMMPEVRELGSRKALQLSGGQQKLVAMARALMCGTRFLLLDEPFEGVAPVLARRLMEVIAGLKSAGMAAILAESSLAHVRDLLDTVFEIDRGEVSTVKAAAGVTPRAGC
ncbi:MAG: ATP-binding cassette domain-containing protein [Burkholderiales bacterium]|nr:ATP-binding cassette domain-containing protein [Burkholderiales bacterium]